MIIQMIPTDTEILRVVSKTLPAFLDFLIKKIFVILVNFC